jgi:hypothetical protein
MDSWFSMDNWYIKSILFLLIGSGAFTTRQLIVALIKLMYAQTPNANEVDRLMRLADGAQRERPLGENCCHHQRI